MTIPRHLSPALALGVAAGGIGLFSVMDAFMKSLVIALGVYNALLWRTMLSTVIGGIAWRVGGGRRIGRRALGLHVARGTITTAMALLFFWGLARVPMAQAIALTYIAPLLALLLGAWLLGERVGARVVGASIVALGGVAVILAGQTRMALGPEALAGAGAILVSAVLYAANLIVARLQSQAAAPREIAFVQWAVTATLLLCAAPWLAVTPPPDAWWKIAVAAALASGSLFLLGWAYAHAEAGFLATTEYTSFVYAAVLGWLFFGEMVAPTTLVGAGVIVAACLYAARRRTVPQGALEGAA
ncbi:S-adenosylmethionine uptake transporter [Sphingomonas sp. BE138]|uniref:DMT family transporter n=1 Tax=Sphingomonas sp. BE138 TaxID=2817845 RepID=UPI00285EFE43|nr:DMT family transporter [Sphingomonas sp. BE138]MDR6788944.1 S-adenosylmethionine uptake transporter [Sphingomonas sp. BE138]